LLDEGAVALSRMFDVSTHRFDNTLVITDADILVGYILSLPDISAELKELDKEQCKTRTDALRARIDKAISVSGAIECKLDAGYVRARKTRA